MDPNVVQQDTTNEAVDPAAQLAGANEKIARMSRDLDELQLEQKLTHKLAAAGAVDLETAVLVAKTRLADRASAHRTTDGERGRSPYEDLDGCVAQLRKEKAYLFAGPAETAAPRRTAPAKDRMPPSPTALEQAARNAARTGNRADLHQYLKLRKNLL
jgi:hypothetical protein